MNEQTSSKHPTGLWFISASYACFMAATIALLSLFTIYFRHIGLDQKTTYTLFAAINALIWIVTLFGGYLAGRFSYKATAVCGALFTLLGTIGIWSHNPTMLYVALAVFTIGYGFCTTAYFNLIGFLYSRNDSRRDSGYTLFYLLFNMGGGFATIVAGFLTLHYGYEYAFVFSSCAMLICFISLIVCLKFLKLHKEYVIAASRFDWHWPSFFIILGAAILGSAICFVLFEHLTLNNILLWLLSFGCIFSILIMASKQKDKIASYKLLAFCIFCIMTAVFWALYTLEPSLLTVFIQQRIQKHIFGITIPASIFYTLDPITVVIFGLFCSWLWPRLEKRNKNPSMPTKFALSLLLIGLGFWLLIASVKLTPDTQLINPLWIILGYVFFGSGEVLLAPISMSMVGKLSPVGKDGLLMGMLNLFTGFGGLIAGYLARFAILPQHATAVVTDEIYSKAFFEIGLFAIGFGIVACIAIPYMKRLIQN